MTEFVRPISRLMAQELEASEMEEVFGGFGEETGTAGCGRYKSKTYCDTTSNCTEAGWCQIDDVNFND